MTFGVRPHSALHYVGKIKWSVSSRVQHLAFFKGRISYAAISVIRGITCLPVDRLLPTTAALPLPSIVIVDRYFSQRPWIAKNSRSVKEILDNANMQIESAKLTAPNLAAVWSTIPRLLSKDGDLFVQREEEITECENQIFNILELVINSLDVLNPRELTTIILGMAKIVQNVRYAKQKRKMNMYQRSFGNVLDEGNYEDSIFHPLAESANYILADFEPRYLSNLAYAYALLGHDPKFHSSTLLGNIADASIGCIEQFNEQDISNTVWAYAKLDVSKPHLFQAVGDIVFRNHNMESFTPQELSNTVWSYASANEQHVGLFKKAGDAIVEKSDLKSFQPQNLANTVWAYATVNIHHPRLFEKVGDEIVQKNDLKSFTPQNIANVLWAYATANEHHHDLFNKLGDVIVEKEDLKSFNPQALSNIVWAYAANNVHHPRVFEKVGDAIVEKNNLESFAPQALAIIVWAYATCNEQNPRLFKKIADTIVEKDNLQSYKPQDFAHLVWAYATANEHHDMFMKVTDEIAKRDDFKSFSPQQLANIAWAYAVSNYDFSSICDNSFRDELHDRQKDFTEEELRQLHQWHLWQSKEKFNDGLSKLLQDKCKQIFLSAGTTSSALQKDVIHVLKDMNLNPVEEYQTQSGYSLDALVEIEGKGVGVEVDGPFHYIGRKPNGSTQLKRRQVTTIDKIHLVSVPYWEWSKLGKDWGKKQKYLRALLDSKLTI